MIYYGICLSLFDLFSMIISSPSIMPYIFTPQLLFIFNYLFYFGVVMINRLDSMLKSKDITLPTKVRLVKAVVFPVVL